MIDRLVKERMPKSSADYIIRKAAESSLLGLSQTSKKKYGIKIRLHILIFRS